MFVFDKNADALLLHALLRMKSFCLATIGAMCFLCADFGWRIFYFKEEKKIKRFFISTLSITLCLLSLLSLSSCSSKEKTFSELYVENVTTSYYMVVNDITFDAEKIELSASDAELYGNDIKSSNGETVKKGYFCAVPELGDILSGNSNNSKEYGAICIWKLLQA